MSEYLALHMPSQLKQTKIFKKKTKNQKKKGQNRVPKSQKTVIQKRRKTNKISPRITLDFCSKTFSGALHRKGKPKKNMTIF